jgi:Domain of unknown function (DUF1877)
MGVRGVHFAITDVQAAALRKARGDDAAVAALLEVIEDAWDEAWLAESDKAWDAIHRALGDGTLAYATPPLGDVVLGGESLLTDDDGDETLVLVEPARVDAAAKALALIDEADFRERYQRLCAGYAPEFGDQDLEYAWSNLADVRALFMKAARAGRHVLFSV